MIYTYSIESIKTAIKNIHDDVSVGDYFAQNTVRENSNGLDQTLINAFFHGDYVIKDDGEREARSKLSADAWDQMIALVSKRAQIKPPTGTSIFIENLLKADSPEHNQSVLQAVENEDFSAQAKLLGDYLKDLPAYDADEMLGLSDEELVRNFPQMYALYSAAQGAVELLDSRQAGIREHLSDESREQLKKLAADMLVFSAVMARYEMICNPRYENVNVVQLAGAENAASKARTVAYPDKGTTNRATVGFFTQVENLAQRNELLFNRDILRGLVNDGFELSSLKIVDLKQKEYSLNSPQGLQIKSAHDQQRPLVIRDGAGNIKALRPENGKFVETNARHLVDNTLHAVMNERLNGLAELATGRQADPIWMLTGSPEYRELKAALAAHAQFAKGCSHPPKATELDELDKSLNALREASIKYLKHKDPDISDDMTFERYMQLKGNGLNSREAARLKAAFTARDLSDDTRSILSLSHELGVKNSQILAVDKTFYQGLLRKHNGLEAKLEALMTHSEKGAELEERINTLLADEKMYSSEHNPYPDDEIATLLWENRQVAELLERTETAMGLRMQDRAIDPKEKARAEASRKFGGDDPALYSVEVLRDRLNAAFAAEGKKQSKDDGPGFWAPEFVVSQKILQSKIVNSNSSKEVREYLKDQANELNSKEKALLEHRIECLEKIEEQERSGSFHPPKTGYIALRDGKPVEGEPKYGDKIMLPGVRQRRNQNTLNGCWSVSLGTQLGYRGVKLEQERIRGYRPDNREAEGTGGSDIEQFYHNRKQVMSEYTGLVSKMLPNSVMVRMQLGWTGAGPDFIRGIKEDFRDAVHHALTKDNSPLSICAGGHYLTIVGMKGDKFYVKNPMHLLGGDPETIETWTLDDFMKKAKTDMEVYWTADITPSLGGSVEPLDRKWFSDGIFYGNGQAYSTSRNDFVKPLNDAVKGISGSVRWGNTNHQVTVFQARNMKYNRLPGGCYNADALEVMEKELDAFYNPGLGGKRMKLPNGVGEVRMQMGVLRDKNITENPHDKMLDLAKTYLKALKEVREARETDPSEQMQNLERTLSRQLNQVRRAVFDAMEADYKSCIGDHENKITYGNREVCPKGMNKGEFEKSRKNFQGMEIGFSGMVYFHQVKSFGPEDQNWINAMRPAAAQKGIAEIKNSEALHNLMEEIHDHALFAENYDAYKEFLSRKAGNPAKKVSSGVEQRIKTFEETPTPEEAKKKLEELPKEKASRIAKAGFTAEEAAKISAGDIVLSMKSASRLRIAARSGKTDVLFNRYLEHLGKVIAKNKAEQSKEIVHEKQNVKEAVVNEQQKAAQGLNM